MTRGEVWYFICPGLTMLVVRVRIVAVAVYTLHCSVVHCATCMGNGDR